MKIQINGMSDYYTFTPGEIAREVVERGIDPVTFTDSTKLKESRWELFSGAYGPEKEKPKAKPSGEKDLTLAERIAEVETLLATEGITSPRLAGMKEKLASGVALKESDQAELAEIEERAPELVAEITRTKKLLRK